MESVFNISDLCAIEIQSEVYHLTLIGAALTGGMGEIKKLEIELWNLKKPRRLTGTSWTSDNIHRNVKSARPKTLIRDYYICYEVITGSYTEKRGNASRNPDANVVTGTFLLNDQYASILFDTGANRSFISTAFSSLINIAPNPLEKFYDVELADGKLVGIDTIIRGCTLNFLDHPFNIDLMPVELGSFDVIIGMDWLRRCHAVIVCDEKLVQIPYGNETLTFCGNSIDSYIMFKSSRVHGKRMTGLFGTDIRQERGGQVRRKTNKGLARSSSGSTSGIPNRLNSRSRARSSSTISIGSIRNE
ncbi:reverse transcriptase domain-containing protein [Tanacetum coccineum]